MTNNKETVTNGIFQIGGENVDYAQFFVGKSYLNTLVADKNVNVGVGNVTFEPGTRNNWHIHHDGYQILLVTAGEGWYQEDGRPARKIVAGDVVVTHNGVKHWHWATKDSWLSHVAITAGTPEWLEPVSDEDYESLED